MLRDIQAIILAAGKSTRFGSEATKLTYPVYGQAMILYSTTLLETLALPTIVVVGYCKEMVQDIIYKHHGSSISTVVQEEQKGTGHALCVSRDQWNAQHILVLNGDVPLVTEKRVKLLCELHSTNNAAISFISAYTSDPAAQSYGRVVHSNNCIEIIEAKDWVEQAGLQHAYPINAGIYIIAREFLTQYITQLNNNNMSKEFYITDLVKLASTNNMNIVEVDAPFDEVRGINTMEELLTVERIQQANQLKTYSVNKSDDAVME